VTTLLQIGMALTETVTYLVCLDYCWDASCVNIFAADHN